MSKQEDNVDNRTIRNWLANVSVFFFKHKYLSLALWLIILTFGTLSYTTLLKREGFPDVQFPITLVKGAYLVDDAQEVDSQVAVPLAEVIGQVEGVESVVTSAQASFFTAVVFIDDEYSADEATTSVKTSIEQSSSIPEASEAYITHDEGIFRKRQPALSVRQTGCRSSWSVRLWRSTQQEA